MAQVRVTCCGMGQVFRNVDAVRRQAPVLFELMLAFMILCVLLVAGKFSQLF